jgi:gamma-glutamylcyclotransferase (GGCT)/AIG2-like uncharacterized protein YtfP
MTERVTRAGTHETVAVYGTLRRGERNAAFLDGATFLGFGRISGRIHVMPAGNARPYAYPALVVGDPGQSVRVELYAIDRPTLARLDVLEAYDALDEAGSEYVRRRVAVVDGPVAEAWTYRYHGPESALGDVIETGDWRRKESRSSRQ